MDWESFANSLTKPCQDEIKYTLSNDASFKEAIGKLDGQIANINTLSKNASQYCK